MGIFDRFKPRDNNLPVKLDDKANPVVYTRRWFILAAYALTYFSWNVGTLRNVSLVPEFALYFNTTNEFRPRDGDLGVDFLPIVDSVTLVAFYPIGGVLVDTYGLKMMKVGAIGQALAFWWWYLAFHNFTSAILARAAGNVFGLLFSVALLRITLLWFAPKQRPLAVGLAVIFTEIGSGLGILLGPIFYEGDGVAILNTALKSCKDEFKETITDPNDDTCTDAGKENFCCYTPTNINLLNVCVAVLSSLIAVYTVIAVRELPPTPPSNIATTKKSPGLWLGLKLMFQHCNYAQICIADFFAAGPVLALVSFLFRVFPASVAGLDILASGIGLAAALPSSILFALLISRTKKFYELTAMAYLGGLICWGGGVICLAIATDASEKLFLLFVAMALILYIVWTIAVYELKAEYIYHPEYNLEGYLVAVDRFIISLSAAVFIPAIPPELIVGTLMPGRVYTFLCGFTGMLIAVILVLTIGNKRDYRRQMFEELGLGDEEDPLHYSPEAEAALKKRSEEIKRLSMGINLQHNEKVDESRGAVVVKEEEENNEQQPEPGSPKGAGDSLTMSL